MNIYALQGHKVKYEPLVGGYEYQKKIAEQYLTPGNEYTVEKTEVSSFNTDVYLKEFRDVKFNAAFFRDVSEQTDEQNKKHPDYERFN